MSDLLQSTVQIASDMHVHGEPFALVKLPRTYSGAHKLAGQRSSIARRIRSIVWCASKSSPLGHFGADTMARAPCTTYIKL